MRLTIVKKTVITIIVFAELLIGISMIMYSRVLTNFNDNNYREKTSDLVATVAEVIDTDKCLRLRDKVDAIFQATPDADGDGHPDYVMSDDWGSDEWNAYMAQFAAVEKDPDFIELRDFLRSISDVNGANCYLAYLDKGTRTFIYLVDSAPEDDACPPGCVDPIYEENEALLTDPERGFPPYMTNTETYGELMTAGAPIYGPDGSVIAYVLTDVSVADIHDTMSSSTWRLSIYLTVATALIAVLGGIIVRFFFIKPVRAIITAADTYDSGDEEKSKVFSKLRIRMRDEIADLAQSMKRMETETNRRVAELNNMNTELVRSRTLADEMAELANKDALTGVRNKTAYDNKIEKLEALVANGYTEFGLAMIDLNYLKRTNDTYGHEAGDAAIVGLCGVICAVFNHSPVYRVGGDEFVVILQNHDFEKARELTDEFKARIDAVRNDYHLPPQERISAAIGCAVFDPETDSSVIDVFNRADRTMYEHKRAMKADLLGDRDPDERRE